MSTDPDADAPLRPMTQGPGLARTVGLAWFLFAVPLIVAGVIVFTLLPGASWWIGLLVGAVVAAVVVFVRWRNALPRLLAALGAEPAAEHDHARYFNLVDGLSLAGGISQPDLYVVPDPGRNVAAAAHRGTSAILITSGLLDAVDRVGLEGLVAGALVRIGAGDAEAATVGASLFGPLLTGPMAVFTRQAAGAGMRHLLESDRDLLADRAAVALTRYPPGLLAALDLIRAGSPDVARRSPATDLAWLVSPSAGGSGADVVTRTPLDLRIDVLGEL